MAGLLEPLLEVWAPSPFPGPGIITITSVESTFAQMGQPGAKPDDKPFVGVKGLKEHYLAAVDGLGKRDCHADVLLWKGRSQCCVEF